MTEAQTQPTPNSGSADTLGALALIAAIIAFLVPIIGVLWFNPIAIILGTLALRAGARKLAIAVLVIVCVKMVISPTFWLNILASGQPGAIGNRIVMYVSVLGAITMIVMLFRRSS